MFRQVLAVSFLQNTVLIGTTVDVSGRLGNSCTALSCYYSSSRNEMACTGFFALQSDKFLYTSTVYEYSFNKEMHHYCKKSQTHKSNTQTEINQNEKSILWSLLIQACCIIWKTVLSYEIHHEILWMIYKLMTASSPYRIDILYVKMQYTFM